MRLKYVKTTNHDRFMAAVRATERRGSPEACIMLLSGDPGTGKTKAVDHFGALRDAIYIEGMPGMDQRYVRDYLADQTRVKFTSKFEQDKGLVEFFRRTTPKKPLILDECQHGLGSKGQVVEYLRRIAEQSGTFLILVCHSSELYRFGEPYMAHIATRISAHGELQIASEEDCGNYLRELCEVGFEDGIVKKAHEESGGRYRLLSNACMAMEAIAAGLGKASLTLADVQKLRLCEDAMRIGRRGRK